MSIKLIIFDLDGTLVNSITDITHSINHAIKPWGIPPMNVRVINDLVGEGITKLIEGILGSERIEERDGVIGRFLEYYSEHLTDNTKPYEGVCETLEGLRGYRKAVVSNKREALSVKLLKELDLYRYFDAILGSDSAEDKKPSPAPVLKVLSDLRIAAEEGVMVGDSTHDITAGRRAGVKTIGVTYGYRDRSYLTDADYIIDDIRELPGLIKHV